LYIAGFVLREIADIADSAGSADIAGTAGSADISDIAGSADIADSALGPWKHVTSHSC
jgi:hypothetical protein